MPAPAFVGRGIDRVRRTVALSARQAASEAILIQMSALVLSNLVDRSVAMPLPR